MPRKKDTLLQVIFYIRLIKLSGNSVKNIREIYPKANINSFESYYIIEQMRCRKSWE